MLPLEIEQHSKDTDSVLKRKIEAAPRDLGSRSATNKNGFFQ
jgi:hypothetical protein